MSPVTSTKVVIAGAAIIAGSNPTNLHPNGMLLAKVAAIVDKSGRVQHTTTDTWDEIPPTKYAIHPTNDPKSIPTNIPLIASFRMILIASLVVTLPEDKAERTLPTVCPPVFPPWPARRGTKYASSIWLESVCSNPFMMTAVREREQRKRKSHPTRWRASL